ncbi:glycosyltransferase [Listeria rocourtiae]|uniref:CgeB family protein n=1 Tax=Listeria rocourtiae TaxID=647910 RepID=UPI001627AD3E|nr:glycosyltransferase [Listeria rocourtiae]MBC1605345.1 glycosyltransferase [Listeria rocourtiae]
MNNLKVLTVGASWRGSNSGSLFNGFRKLGCDVRTVETDTDFYNYSLSERLYMRIYKMPLKRKFEKFNQRIRMEIDNYKPNILFVVKGLWVSEETIFYAKQRNVKTIHFHPDFLFDDCYHTSEILNKAILAYDVVVTPKTTEVRKYKEYGCENVHFTRYAFDPDIHRKIEMSMQDAILYQADVAFVGRMEPFRAKALDRIAQEEYDLKVWGTKWDKIPYKYELKNHCTLRPAFCEEMVKVFQGAKISIGFLTKLSREQHTARTFEIPACGGFLLGMRTDEQMEILKPGVEADFFDTTEELLEKVAFYIKNETVRERIAQKGYEKVIKMNATYENRVKEILTFLK